jgi:hypothetical protein
MKTVIRQQGFSMEIDIDALRRIGQAYNDLIHGSILYNAVRELQAQAFFRMRDVYYAKKSNRVYPHSWYKNRPASMKLEQNLFKRVPVPTRQGNSYYFSIIPEYAMNTIPQLEMLEYGIRAHTDMQPYEITGRGLRAIKKMSAMTRKVYMGRATWKHIGEVKYIKVQHPAIAARGFIKAGNGLIKTQGMNILTSYIKAKVKEKYKI